jgi:hypothetical protein
MMSLRPVAFLLLAGSAFAQTPPRTAAPPAEIGTTVQFAPGGDLVGPWQSYSVELDSKTTRGLDLVIRIEDDGHVASATRREHLAAGAKKRVFLHAPAGIFPRGVSPRYQITDASGRELASGIIALSQRGYVASFYQMALFSRATMTGDDFGIPSSLNGQEIHFGRLDPGTFPDRWIGLAAIDLLLIHDAPLDELTPDQSRALADYVRQGGTVVLSPGTVKGWLTHPVLAAFAPVHAAEPRLVPSLPGVNSVYGGFRRADPFLVHPLQNGEPFKTAIGREIVRLPFGFGRTYVLGFDLLRAPFDEWNGRRGLWGDLLTASPRWFQDARTSFPSAATARQRLELFQQMARLINPYPPFGLILGLAAIFLVAVGPLNYLLLWRLRRTLLLVVTVPAISLGFLGFILALGYVLKGTTTVVHSARLLSTSPGLDCAREVHLYSLFSPSTRTYDVAFEPGTFGQAPVRWTRPEERVYSRQESMTALTCETGAGLTLRGLGAGQWQSFDLEAHALRDLGQGIRFEVEGGQVRISNGSARFIERGLFVQTGQHPVEAAFGEVPPGKTGEAKTAPGRISPLVKLGLPLDSLGDRLLRPWLDAVYIRSAQPQSIEKMERFLVCILRNEGDPVRVDARISDRSRSITLLHVAEAAP